MSTRFLHLIYSIFRQEINRWQEIVVWWQEASLHLLYNDVGKYGLAACKMIIACDILFQLHTWNLWYKSWEAEDSVHRSITFQVPQKNRPIRPIERLTFDENLITTLVSPFVRLSLRGQLAKMVIALVVGNSLIRFWHMDRYRHDLANELAKYEFLLTEAKPRQKM